MNHSIKILNVDTAYSQANDKHFLDIEVEVSKEGEVVEVRRFGYPLNTDKEFIIADLKKLAITLDSDAVNAEKSAESDKAFKNANDVKESLSGVEIKDK